MRKCQWCGRIYDETKAAGQDRFRFCSARCQNAYNNNEKRERATRKAEIAARKEKIRNLNQKMFGRKDDSYSYQSSYQDYSYTEPEDPKDAEIEALKERIKELENQNSNRTTDVIPVERFDGNGIDLKSQFPCLVMRINVKIGDYVKKDQVLLVTEAMKLECWIFAPFDGIVSSILVSTGQSVRKGEAFLILKGAKDDEKDLAYEQSTLDNEGTESDSIENSNQYDTLSYYEPRGSKIKAVILGFLKVLWNIIKYIGIGIYYIGYGIFRVIWAILSFMFIHKNVFVPLLFFVILFVIAIVDELLNA